ncbi:hypothetical protein SDC9_145952 [bioreactor metagenome]|uniref:DUF3307 domain-containing protein n=1 Tax=bioreactor metagenome TaxID=1076179 RepID=A0A645EDU3_9ZZZZ|nr:hypothetical protein [Candidatus Metalachnospira sp.]
MRIEFFILICMIFFHIIDDFHLQGWLANAKQKSWWEKNAPDTMYKYDYLVALLIHSFSWTFMIMIVPTVFTAYWKNVWYPFLFVGNMVIHFIVDDAKANKHKINLIQDQSIHILQIIFTWFCMTVFLNS